MAASAQTTNVLTMPDRKTPAAETVANSTTLSVLATQAGVIDGDASVHVAGAGEGRRDRSAQQHLLTS